MKCICTQKCFRPNARGINVVFKIGQIEEFDKCPASFTELNPSAPIDILTAGEDELMETTFSFSHAEGVIKGAFGVDLEKTDKAGVVAQILDARVRSVDTSDPEIAK